MRQITYIILTLITGLATCSRESKQHKSNDWRAILLRLQTEETAEQAARELDVLLSNSDATRREMTGHWSSLKFEDRLNTVFALRRCAQDGIVFPEFAELIDKSVKSEERHWSIFIELYEFYPTPMRKELLLRVVNAPTTNARDFLSAMRAFLKNYPADDVEEVIAAQLKADRSDPFRMSLATLVMLHGKGGIRTTALDTLAELFRGPLPDLQPDEIAHEIRKLSRAQVCDAALVESVMEISRSGREEVKDACREYLGTCDAKSNTGS